MLNDFLSIISDIISNSGFAKGDPLQFLMILVACVLIYLAIAKEYEPLLLLPIAFGMLLTNLPFANLYHPELFIGEGRKIDIQNIVNNGGLLDFLYLGVKFGIYPPLIFLGIGAMTDFGPLLSNPKSILLGAAAQVGIFVTFICALLLGFEDMLAASVAIIGGADGPTAIYVASLLAPAMLGPIAVAAYSYMALVPMIQPPIMRLLTTKKERQTVMGQLRTVSKLEKIVFPIVVTILICLFLPDAAPLVGMLMLGNLFRESGVVERISKTAQNELINIITIFLGLSVGATATAENFLNPQTLGILALGLVAFAISTASGVLFGKIMYYATGGKVNPLIGSAGVSAVPMSARVSQKVASESNPGNFILMHAMGPNIAGVICSAVAAGVFLAVFK